jgi:hypothetical protein
MKQRAWPILALIVCGSICVSQNSSRPSSPPTPSRGNSGFPMRVPNPDPYGIQRKLDEERMHPTEPPTKPVDIAELEKILESNRNTSDEKLAAILEALSLTERVTPARLSRWNLDFSGPKTRQVLIALSASSAFLSLPAVDLSPAPPPTISEQRRIISDVAKYLGTTLPSLPGLVATRHTIYFQDNPPRQFPTSTDPTNEPHQSRPLHATGTSTFRVAYVLGQEVSEKRTKFEGSLLDASRFSTAGEFGPILYGVMMDASRSNLAWRSWESGREGVSATFQFDTPKDNSHFSLKPPWAASSKIQFVAYHGEISVNPADGTIVRLLVVARPTSEDGLAEAGVIVEYGAVDIGHRNYFCPIHAVALSKVSLQTPQPAEKGQLSSLQTQVNDVTFDNYQIFRGDTRILLESQAGP